MPSRRNRKPNRSVFLLSGVAVLALAGIVVISSLRSPVVPEAGATTVPSPESSTTPPTLPTTTTAPGPSFEERGMPFEWRRTLELDGDIGTVGIVEHEGATFLFTSSPRPPGGGAYVGLDIWTTDNGVNWVQLGSIDDRYQVTRVVGSGFGLLALGRDTETGDGVAWRSSDGITWDPTVIMEGRPGLRADFHQAVATGDMIVLIGGYSGDDLVVDRRVRQALVDHVGHEVLGYTWNRWEDPATLQIAVFGPLGVLLHQLTLADIGLTEDDLRGPDIEYVPNSAWISVDGTTWQHMTGDPWGEISVWAGPDGRLWGNGVLPDVGVGVMATADGVEWEMVGTSDLRGAGIVQFPGGLIAQAFSPPGVAMSNAEGLVWRVMTMGSVFGHFPPWHPQVQGGGADGIAIVANTDSFFGSQADTEAVPPAIWSDDGFTVLLRRDEIEILEDDRVVSLVPRNQQTTDRNVRYDPAAGSLTFLHPLTGNDLVTLDATAIAALLAAENTLRHERAFLFSDSSTWATPGEIDPLSLPRDWTVQDLAPITDRHIHHLAVVSDRVVMVTWDQEKTEILIASIPRAG